MVRYKYSDELLQEVVATSLNYAEVLRKLGIKQAGGNQTHIKNRVTNASIDTSHFTGQAWSRNKKFAYRRSANEILILHTVDSRRENAVVLRRCMLELGQEMICVSCGISDSYNGKPIQVEVDHINGNHWDNRIENLRFLCPNCHSQQTTNKAWKYKLLPTKEK